MPMKKALVVLFACFSAMILKAQESGKVNVIGSTNEGASGWYTSPWAWLIYSAVFILLLLSILPSWEKTRDQ